MKTDPSIFRQSILPMPMKILGKIVHDQVSAFIKEFLNYIYIGNLALESYFQPPQLNVSDQLDKK